MASLSFARLVLAALILLSLGCGDPVGPLDVAGTYVLENADTRPLAPDAPPGTMRMLGDTIQLRVTGLGIRSFTFQYVFFDRGIELVSVKQPLEFSVDGDRLLIASHCPSDRACLGGFPTYVVHRTATGFRRAPWHGEDEELQYVRID